MRIPLCVFLDGRDGMVGSPIFRHLTQATIAPFIASEARQSVPELIFGLITIKKSPQTIGQAATYAGQDEFDNKKPDKSPRKFIHSSYPKVWAATSMCHLRKAWPMSMHIFESFRRPAERNGGRHVLV